MWSFVSHWGASSATGLAVTEHRLGFPEMVARVRLLQARVLPHGWLDALRQVSLFAAAYLAYRLVRGLVEGDANAAFAHARDLISLERTLHVFVEPSVQAWASGSHMVMVLASWLYVNAQTTVTFGALLYLYLLHNRNFYFVRNMFMIAMAIALVAYAVFPTAPPRFMPEWGFIDSVSDLTGVRVSHASATASTLFNPYAAVPSMHVAFALMIGAPLARLAERRVVSVLWMLYPVLMTFVIVVTANHFIVDALLGALTAGASAYGASWLARTRPAIWRFSAVAPTRLTARIEQA
jgi:PAP2 superfamily